MNKQSMKERARAMAMREKVNRGGGENGRGVALGWS